MEGKTELFPVFGMPSPLSDESTLQNDHGMETQKKNLQSLGHNIAPTRYVSKV